MTPTTIHHRAKGARSTDCGRSMGLSMGHGLYEIGGRSEVVLRDARQTTCEGCLDAMMDARLAGVRRQPLHSVRVGARVRLLPDDQVRLKTTDYRFNPNASLGIAMDETHEVSEVLVTEGVVLIGVVGNDVKRVDMRRFTTA